MLFSFNSCGQQTRSPRWLFGVGRGSIVLPTSFAALTIADLQTPPKMRSVARKCPNLLHLLPFYRPTDLMCRLTFAIGRERTIYRTPIIRILYIRGL